MDKDKLKKEFIEIIDKSLAANSKEIALLVKALPIITEYAAKNSTINKRLQTKLEEIDIYGYIEKKQSWTTTEMQFWSLNLSSKGNNERVTIWPNQSHTEEQKTKMLPDEVKKRIDYLQTHNKELAEDQKQADKVIKALEAVEQIKEKLKKEAGRMGGKLVDSRYDLPYSISGFINDNLERW